MPEHFFTRHGKEMLFNGKHFADFANEDSAEMARIILEHGKLPRKSVTKEEMLRQLFEKYFK